MTHKSARVRSLHNGWR